MLHGLSQVVASPMTSIGGAPGEGMFTLKEDHRKLGPILKWALKEKLLSCLKAQDLLGDQIFWEACYAKSMIEYVYIYIYIYISFKP